LDICPLEQVQSSGIETSLCKLSTSLLADGRESLTLRDGEQESPLEAAADQVSTSVNGFSLRHDALNLRYCWREHVPVYEIHGSEVGLYITAVGSTTLTDPRLSAVDSEIFICSSFFACSMINGEGTGERNVFGEPNGVQLQVSFLS
jgi:hypothetical protein